MLGYSLSIRRWRNTKIISGDLGIFKGALYENMAAQIFQRKHKKCYYFEPSQTTEIDFIIEYEGEITPIDIKAGLNTASKSFKNFVEKYKPIHAFRFSQKNIGIAKEGNIVYLPALRSSFLFLIFFVYP